MTAAFNGPPCSNNKYLCILDDVATHARAITNQLTLFRRKKGQPLSEQSERSGFDFRREKEGDSRFSHIRSNRTRPHRQRIMKYTNYGIRIININFL